MAEDPSLQKSLDNKSSFPSTPTKRGHPHRIRKPNPRIFGTDDNVTPKKKITPQTQRSVATALLSTPDKKAAQAIGVRLKNLLKLPKAHKWVCYEWFYSNIDRPLFDGENDFAICMKESFPQLKTRMLTRLQWCKVRRLMGKPRRCSPAFFEEERAALQRKREKIRLLQQRKAANIADMKDLPDEIPMSLVVGTKVTARLRKPQDGLFTGTVDALDFMNMTYRISFDRQGLGTHSVPDIEVLSNEPSETMPLSVFQMKHRPSKPSSGIFTPPRSTLPPSPGVLVTDNDPLLGSSPLRPSYPEGSTYGGFPIDFLILVTKLTKILAVKKEKIKEIKEMNTSAEKQNSFGEEFDLSFQQQYASVMLDLYQLNKELRNLLVGVQQHCSQIAPDQGVTPLDHSAQIKAICDEKATHLVAKHNGEFKNKCMVRQERSTDLITNLTSLLYQLKTLSENEMHSFEFKSLQDSLEEIKGHIDPANLSVLQNNVEIHINHVQSGLTQMGNLHAFAAAALPTV